MANTLSQYIGQIIDRRNQELQQRLAPLIPLLQADLAETRRKAEIERQKQLRISDYGKLAAQSFDAEQEWLDAVAQVQTAEGVDATWKSFAAQKALGFEVGNRISVLRQMGLPEDKLAQAQQAMAGLTDTASMDKVASFFIPHTKQSEEELRNAIQRQSAQGGKDFEQGLKLYGDPDMAAGFASDQQARREAYSHRSGSRSLASGNNDKDDLPKVTEHYRVKRDKVFGTELAKENDETADIANGYVVMMISGKKTAVPATIGRDERLYLVGEEGLYHIDPGRCLEDKDYIRHARKDQVDRWNTGKSAPQKQSTQPQKQSKTKDNSLPDYMRQL